ncbi:hypothetical protein K474DRAFT_1667369 [Panus rudis PR-1116 ss-1]|nr:hypothetical protein K474DRAFT_1667369 [Panus rudis PR-1116 ss-1]
MEHEFVPHDHSLISHRELESRSPEDAKLWLEEQSNKALKYLLALHSYRNTLSPIHRLPNELLAEIFSISAHFCDTPTTVIYLSHVCRRWRSLILQLPKFWSTIDVENLDRTRAFFARSQDQPVTIYWGPRPDRWMPLSDLDSNYIKKYSARFGLVDDLKPLIVEHSKRIRKICIKRQLPEDVTWLFRDPDMEITYPSLEELIIDTKHPILLSTLPPDNADDIVNFCFDSAPKLTTLMLRGHRFTWDLEEVAFQGLRVLKLHDMESPSRLLHSAFMEALDACPDLEHLELHSAGPNAIMPSPYPPSPYLTDPLVLSKLRKLDLDLETPAIRDLLKCIVVPESATIQLSCTSVRELMGVDIIPRGCNHLLPLRRVVKIVIRSDNLPTTFSIEGWSSGPNEERVFELSIRSPWSTAQMDLNAIVDIDNSLSLLSVIFPRQLIHTVILAIAIEPTQPLDFLQNFPRLVTVEYGSSDTLDVVRAKRGVATVASIDQLRTILMLWGLQKLTLNNLDLPDETCVSMEGLLMARNRMGLAKLKSLTVLECEFEGSPRSSLSPKEWKEKLGPLVDEFEYQEVDRESYMWYNPFAYTTEDEDFEQYFH